MPAPEAISKNLTYWLMVLKGLRTQAPSVFIKAGQTLELDDSFFDQPDQSPCRWFRLDPGAFDLFIDDSDETIHLANFTEAVQYANPDTPLATWYGHDSDRYDVVINSPEGPSPVQLAQRKLVWFAWDARLWRLYAHDGGSIIPVFSADEIAETLNLAPHSRIWMGWNGESLDLFTVEPDSIPDNLCAAFITHDHAVGTVKRTNT